MPVKVTAASSTLPPPQFSITFSNARIYEGSRVYATFNVTVKNTAAWVSNNTYTRTYYNFRVKFHTAENWAVYYSYPPSLQRQSADYEPTYVLWNQFSDGFGPIASTGNVSKLFESDAYGTQTDVQVKVLQYTVDASPGMTSPPFYHTVTILCPLISAESDWSETQTVTIPELSAVATPSPSPSPIARETLSPFTTPTAKIPTQVIVQTAPIWFYVILIGMAVVIASLLAVIALMLRGKSQSDKEI
jgi:hypothetical protein